MKLNLKIFNVKKHISGKTVKDNYIKSKNPNTSGEIIINLKFINNFNKKLSQKATPMLYND